jgi:hypothetical protein
VEWEPRRGALRARNRMISANIAANQTARTARKSSQCNSNHSETMGCDHSAGTGARGAAVDFGQVEMQGSASLGQAETDSANSYPEPQQSGPLTVFIRPSTPSTLSIPAV